MEPAIRFEIQVYENGKASPVFQRPACTGHVLKTPRPWARRSKCQGFGNNIPRSGRCDELRLEGARSAQSSSCCRKPPYFATALANHAALFFDAAKTIPHWASNSSSSFPFSPPHWASFLGCSSCKCSRDAARHYRKLTSNEPILCLYAFYEFQALPAVSTAGNSATSHLWHSQLRNSAAWPFSPRDPGTSTDGEEDSATETAIVP